MHPCDKCSASFKRRGDLNRHGETHRSRTNEADQERLLSCGSCEHTSFSKQNMRIHMLTHDDKKSQICPDENCDFSCNDPSSLLRHRKSKHGFIPKLRKRVPRRQISSRNAPSTMASNNGEQSSSHPSLATQPTAAEPSGAKRIKREKKRFNPQQVHSEPSTEPGVLEVSIATPPQIPEPTSSLLFYHVETTLAPPSSPHHIETALPSASPSTHVETTPASFPSWSHWVESILATPQILENPSPSPSQVKTILSASQTADASSPSPNRDSQVESATALFGITDEAYTHADLIAWEKYDPVEYAPSQSDKVPLELLPFDIPYPFDTRTPAGLGFNFETGYFYTPNPPPTGEDVKDFRFSPDPMPKFDTNFLF